MLKKVLGVGLLIGGFIYFNSQQIAEAWGFYAHKRINYIATFTQPSETFEFYKRNIDFIAEHATDPDKRRYANKLEAPRHFIDLDRYGDKPFDVLPKNWSDAVKKFGEDSLMAHGIVPWHLEKTLYKLTEAFKNEDLDAILQTSADLGHYVGDAHVPLHTTQNYNGQLTNQHGIHGFWESRIPELYEKDYKLFTGKAVYIKNPKELIWKIVGESYAAKDSVLNFEAELNKAFPADRKYAYETRGTQMMKVYSQEYTKAFDLRMDGMVERRMKSAIIVTGCFWYTAWVNAGKPDLKRLYDKQISEAKRKELELEDQMWNTGKIHGRSCD